MESRADSNGVTANHEQVVALVGNLIAEVRALRAELVKFQAENLDLRRAQVQSQAEAVSIETAGMLIGCRRSKVFELISAGKLQPTAKVGRSRMVTRASVEALLAVPARPPAPEQRTAPPRAPHRRSARAEAAAIRALR